MTTPRDCLMFVVLVMGLDAVVGIPGEHYHRYMLSDYRRQHNNKTQMDYYPIPRPTYSEHNKYADRFSMVLVDMLDSTDRSPLSQLLVRIFDGKQYLCMGTFLSEMIVMTSESCFISGRPHNLTMKTSTNIVLDQFEVIEDSEAVKLLVLKEPWENKKFSAKLCDSPIKYNSIVSLTTYIRSRREVHSQTSMVLPLRECRRLLDDPDGELVKYSMICVKNEKRTSECQKTFGNPLIYKGKVCGVNILGHNCPKYYGVDLYAGLLNEVEYFEATLKIIKASKIEDIL